MSNIVERITQELDIPPERVINEGAYRFLEMELRNLSSEKAIISSKHGVSSFDQLWEKIERGEISENECFYDLTKLEYLELQVEKLRRVMEGCDR